MEVGSLGSSPVPFHEPAQVSCNMFGHGVWQCKGLIHGCSGGAVWGTNPRYTGDSNKCSAARHAGLIDSNGGFVQIVEHPGLSQYPGVRANGVESQTWGAFAQSFELKALSSPINKKPGKATPGTKQGEKKKAHKSF